jgi:hypothetical protein
MNKKFIELSREKDGYNVLIGHEHNISFDGLAAEGIFQLKNV